MTRFEASVIMFMVMAIMLILLFGVISIISTLNDIKQQHENAKDSILDACNQQQSAWACDMTTIVKGINELNDVVDKMHRNLCVEIADKMVDRVYPPTHDTPCYAPDNTMNTIKVKGKRCELTDEELMKRINEDKKED